MQRRASYTRDWDEDRRLRLFAPLAHSVSYRRLTHGMHSLVSSAPLVNIRLAFFLILLHTMSSGLKQSAQFLARRRRQMYQRILRVDHAGELGADRIYSGQMAVLASDPTAGPVIQHMWDQEKAHLKEFDKLTLQHRVSKSLLTPLWSLAGFALGAGTAILGPKSAMACTVAVETVISQHYDDQIRQLIADDAVLHKDLITRLSQFRDDEQDHHDTGLAHGAEQAVGYQVLRKAIESVCRVAIKVAERI